ncbi:response regulator [Cohnella endophytica]|uniref:Response regulator n=1 Tax=Cohnella endophytica TaxID=2419778 RepID=A0A494XH62_9BACL|nr:response regulator [Cohnella endophytica]RKP49990.1 response regulator [Cohnella endophytica]
MAYNVLIIDDEPWSRQVVKSLGQWDSLGLKVVGEAEDGNEGIRKMGKLAADIVVTDMRMPGLEGVELLQEMNERYPAAKIIVMSGYDDFVYLKQAIRSRAVNYLLKPIDPEELGVSLAQCIRELDESVARAREAEPERQAMPPAIFQDTVVLEHYASYRKMIYGYLLELKADAVRDSFRKLGAYLETNLQDAAMPDAGLPTKIAHDFTTMLEEFASGHELRLDLLQNGTRTETEGESDSQSENRSPIAEATRKAGLLYEAAILAIVGERKSKAKLNIDDVQAHIERFYPEAISLETIAQRFFVSKEHLSRAYKAATGENVTDAIVRKRMEAAKSYILDEGLSIKHAAQLTGYADIAYFYRVFKKHYGVTPGDLRKE